MIDWKHFAHYFRNRLKRVEADRDYIEGLADKQALEYVATLQELELARKVVEAAKKRTCVACTFIEPEEPCEPCELCQAIADLESDARTK